MIQPHGALLFVDERDLVVLSASDNAAAFLGCESITGASASALFDPASEAAIRRAIACQHPDAFAIVARGTAFDASVHRVSNGAVIELEPHRPAEPTHVLLASGDRMFAARSLLEAAMIAAHDIAAIIGFESVAVYRFHPDAVTLLAATRPGAPAFPELHHALAPDARLRFILDREATPVAVPPHVDLSRALLRSPSLPGTGASLTIALDGFGVIACDDPTPRHVTAGQRAACAAIGRFLRWQLATFLRAAEHGNGDELIANVSHELRTPLHALVGWLDLLLADAVPPDRRDHALATAKRNARVLSGLVDDMLDSSRVVAGKLRLDMQLVSPAPIVDAALATIQPAAAAKRVVIDAHVDRDAGHVLADPLRFQQVVSNLLVNAVKFTPEGGGVRVTLRADATAIVLGVSDDGAGIDPAFLPYVFERYRQAQRGTGLGLGLAIVRELVDLHGGDVTAESDGPGRGATFTVRLPRAAAHATAPLAVDDPTTGPIFEPAPQLRGLRALVVDGDPESRELLETILRASDVEVEIAPTACDASVLLARHRFGVLIADVSSEEGYDLIQQVRGQADPVCRIPAVAITAHTRRHERARAFLAGFDVHLAKPIDPTELLAILVGVTGRRTQSRPAIDTDIAQRPLDGARLLIVDDDADNRDMLGALLEVAGATVHLAATASEGLAAVSELRPDVLLSDLGLPDKDGLQLIRELRAAGPERGGWVPAIAISGRATPEDSRAAILAGFQLLLSKPFEPTDLVRRLARLVRRNQT